MEYLKVVSAGYFFLNNPQPVLYKMLFHLDMQFRFDMAFARDYLNNHEQMYDNFRPQVFEFANRLDHAYI